MDILCLVGLPGSGKSFLAGKLSSEYNAVIIDDPRSFAEIKKTIEDNPGRNFIICDCFFCEAVIRQRAEVKLKGLGEAVRIHWYFFENNSDQCRQNVVLRDDGRNVEASIKRFSKTYRIPDGVDIIPVWRPNNE